MDLMPVIYTMIILTASAAPLKAHVFRTSGSLGADVSSGREEFSLAEMR